VCLIEDLSNLINLEKHLLQLTISLNKAIMVKIILASMVTYLEILSVNRKDTKIKKDSLIYNIYRNIYQ
jgi:hypothetical protein